jgi:hypothetical protein
MRQFLLICLILSFQLLRAQVTLQQTAPNETFDLNGVALKVEDVAVIKGHHVLPYNLSKGQYTNLLHWRYFDKFLQKMTTYPRPLYGEDCVQMLDDLKDTDTVSLHINLSFTADSIGGGRKQYLFLLVGGLVNKTFVTKTWSCEHYDEIFTPLRFSAIAQIAVDDLKSDVYEITEGILSFDLIDIKADQFAGTFEFTSEQVGISKRAFFVNGKFKK